MNFEQLGLAPEILRNIPHKTPTEIQAKSIPLILDGKDVIAGSATGSGKTLAFSSGIIQRMQGAHHVEALVLVPTRELAQQVAEEFSRYSRGKAKVTSVYGGVGLNPQVEAIRRSNVVVGTPGRVLDLIERNALHLSRVKFVVLDEADRMFEMGFIEDVREIIRECPRERQTMLFSATISREVSEIADQYMNSPVEVAVESYVDPSKLRQVYYDIYDDKLKFSLLVHLLRQEHTGLIMVFCNTQQTTDFIARNLRKNGIDAIPIHGGLSQSKRNTTIEGFHRNKFGVLVCTDVAARGLHIEGVSHVYNYDIPRDPKAYVHRIGRTARAGKDGIAINILGSRDHENFTAVLSNNDVKIDRVEMPQFSRASHDGGRPDRFEGRRSDRRGERPRGQRHGPKRNWRR